MNIKKIASAVLAFACAFTFLAAVPGVSELKLSAAEGDVAIDEAHFPDIDFRAWVSKNADKDNDGVLSAEEIAAVTSLYINGYEYDNLIGVEYFTAINKIDFYGCPRITSLDLTKNKALKSVGIYNNSSLASINLRGLTDVESLACYGNALTSLDLSTNTALKSLNCRNNKITSINVKNCYDLDYVVCFRNQLTALDFSGNPKLRYLECDNNLLTVLDLSNNLSLEYLSCTGNRITSMDMSKHTALGGFYWSGNTYDIYLKDGKTFDLSTLPGKFNVANSSDWYNGTVSGNILTVNSNANYVTYRYYAGRGSVTTVRLNVTKAPAVPDKPNVTATAGNGQVTLTWNSVYGAKSYVVYMLNASTGTYTQLATTTGIIYIKTGLTNGTTYKFIVRAKNDVGLSPFTSSDAVSVTPTAPIPAKPNVTATAGNGQVTLKWYSVYGATSYIIYQYNPTTNTYAQIVTTTGTSYTKTGLTNGTTYKFAVRAKNSYGMMSPWTTDDVVSATPVAPVAPAKPVITVTNGNGQATLKWNAVSGATSYVIYQYNPTTGAYETVITTTATTYTKTGLTNGTTYKFAVRAKNAYGMSAWTTADAVTAKPVAPAVPAKPVITVTNGNGQVTLKWNAVSGATSYVVYMYNASTGTYETVITTTATTYTKTGLTNGTTYKFAVRAKNSYGMSAWTTADAVTAKPTAPAVPAKPVITVTNGNGQATLKWNPVSGATSYVVYMYNASTGTYETVITTTATTYTKTGLTNGTTYKFAVRAKNSYGLSPWTTADAVTAKPVVSSVPAKPAVKATAGNGSVTLSWNAVSGATKYYIYMYNTSTGTYQLLTTTTALTYTKTGLSNGTAYKFIVRAYNENGQSAYTAADAVSATPKA